MSKSLEIVNKNIKAIKKLLYNLKDIQEGTKEDFDKYYHEQELKEQQQIKQDLEVLEILKNKTKYMLEDEVDRFEIFSLDEKISKEDYNKVKQWLEENENDR